MIEYILITVCILLLIIIRQLANIGVGLSLLVYGVKEFIIDDKEENDEKQESNRSKTIQER